MLSSDGFECIGLLIDGNLTDSMIKRGRQRRPPGHLPIFLSVIFLSVCVDSGPGGSARCYFWLQCRTMGIGTIPGKRLYYRSTIADALVCNQDAVSANISQSKLNKPLGGTILADDKRQTRTNRDTVKLGHCQAGTPCKNKEKRRAEAGFRPSNGRL